MSLLELMKAIRATPIGTVIAENAFLFPVIECVHVLAITFVVGTILMVDLRLLNVAARHRNVSVMEHEILPYTWAAFVLAAITGALLFTSNAPKYYVNWFFRIKFVFMACAAINMLVLHFVTSKDIKAWEGAGIEPPAAAKLAGALSLFFWLLVIIFGRWIGFTLGV